MIMVAAKKKSGKVLSIRRHSGTQKVLPEVRYIRHHRELSKGCCVFPSFNSVSQNYMNRQTSKWTRGHIVIFKFPRNHVFHHVFLLAKLAFSVDQSTLNSHNW